MADLSSLSLPLSRQQYTRAQKADIVEQSMAPGVSIASVAMAHGINANQLYKWRYLYKKGELGSMRQPSNCDALELLPVRVALDVPLHTKARPSSSSTYPHEVLVLQQAATFEWRVGFHGRL